MPETDRITALEKRLTTVELLLNDVMHQLDKPSNKPPRKATYQKKKQSPPPVPKKDKPKPTPPSEIVAALLKEKPLTQSEIESATGMETEALKKCIGYMERKNLIECDSEGTYSLPQE